MVGRKFTLQYFTFSHTFIERMEIEKVNWKGRGYY